MIQIRKDIFETNSSSQHSIVVTKNNNYEERQNLVTETGKYTIYDGFFVNNGYLIFYGDDLEFSRHPFQILYAFPDKVRYAIASLVGSGSCDTKEKLKEIEDITKKILPEIKGFKFDMQYGYEENDDELPDTELLKEYYGYVDHQSMGLLESFLEEKSVSLEEFLTNEKYWVIIDGDEYCDFERYVKHKIINVDNIESIYPE